MYIHIFIEHILDPIYASKLTHNVMSYIEYIQHMEYNTYACIYRIDTHIYTHVCTHTHIHICI